MQLRSLILHDIVLLSMEILFILALMFLSSRFLKLMQPSALGIVSAGGLDMEKDMLRSVISSIVMSGMLNGFLSESGFG